MKEGGLDAEGKVNELERDGLIKQILYKSATWLETVISAKLQGQNELAKKQIFLSHMKLHNQTLRAADLLKLDSLLSTPNYQLQQTKVLKQKVPINFFLFWLIWPKQTKDDGIFFCINH